MRTRSCLLFSEKSVLLSASTLFFYKKSYKILKRHHTTSVKLGKYLLVLCPVIKIITLSFAVE